MLKYSCSAIVQRSAILFIMVFVPLSAVHKQNWVARYRFDNPRDYNHQLIAEKKELSPFSQLLFAWNGKRPSKGYLSFFVQVKDAQTGTWGALHHAIDWGVSRQRSYKSTSDGTSAYMHVRLELEKGKKANGFRLICKQSERAVTPELRTMIVTTVDMEAFVPEVDVLMPNKSVCIFNVPRLSQHIEHPDADRICSPTSCTMLLRFLNTTRTYDLVHIARAVYDAGLDTYGSWPFNMAYAYEHSDERYTFFHTRLSSFCEVIHSLEQKIPVIVSVRGNIPGAPKAYNNGHLLVIVGYDALRKQVVCHDPAHTDNNVLVHYALSDFLKAWELSRRLAYCALPIPKGVP